jgi:DNA-binding response OmpR family regulator
MEGVMKKILIIEDDPAVREGLKTTLEQERFEVHFAVTGREGYEKATHGNIDLILLDLILPDMDGTEICKSLRKDGINIPILMVTGKKEEIDKIVGLEVGADDYITKPFSTRELIARIKAILRRTSEYLTEGVSQYKFSNIELDFKKMEARKEDRIINLSATEFAVLKYFIIRKGEVITRDQLLDDVWGYEAFPTTRTVDNYILSLRKKIEDDPHSPKYLLTVPKLGYKFYESE